MPVAGCATVSVYEPVSAEISLTEEQSQLQKAADTFSTRTRDKKLATGEASLSTIADILSGKRSDDDAYWRVIGADKSAVTTVVSRIRDDMNTTSRGLGSVNALARTLIASGDLTREDVSAFESALIHARQARDSLSDAFAQVNKRATAEYQVSLEMAPLDEGLSRARAIADDLAAARSETEEPVGS